MGLLRSDEMAFAQLVLPPAEAKKYIEAIGLEENCNVQFEDSFAQANAHAGTHRPYLKPIQRVKELERILRTFSDPNTGLIVKYAPNSPIVTGHVETYLKRVRENDTPNPFSLDAIERELTAFDTKLSAQLALNDALIAETKMAHEELAVIQRAVALLGGGSGLDTPLLHGSLNSIAGVIASSELAKLKRSLWRASRGKAFVDGTDSKNGNSVFVVYFQGAGDGAEGALMGKVRRLCQNSSAHLFPWPSSSKDAITQQEAKEAQIKENNQILESFKSKMQEELKEMLVPVDELGGNSKIEDYRLFCLQQKSAFAILNLFESSGRNMKCNIWYSADPDEKAMLDKTLASVSAKEPAILVPDFAPPPGAVVPTYIKTNDFTEPWQEVVDTYGVPNYKTANPAMVTTITFPFVFGMMYGDIGHGSILFLAGCWMVWNGDKYKYATGYAQLIHWARYMILSMGFFAVFAGFMYNDLFGMVSLDIPGFGGTRWNCTGSGTCSPREGFNTENVAKMNDGAFTSGPYPFGLDPTWDRASNGLIFNNSLKMKLSVLIGVMQMLLGVYFKFANSIHDGSVVDIVCECVPMLIFMVCFFGYMDFMIVYKWTHVIPTGPPGIINALICMAMHKENPPQMYTGSPHTESMLMMLTALSVPWILIPKPLILRYLDAKKRSKTGDADEESVPVHGGHGHGGEFVFSEVLIHQIIETIEYVLGTVSHTASYLRVWALSLAHQQLSLVFYTKTIQMGFGLCSTLGAPVGGIIMFFLFGAWFAVTCAVLLAMDVLECFLHTLRLHWVEFQSKFYGGKNEGIKFAPFNLIKVLTAAES